MTDVELAGWWFDTSETAQARNATLNDLEVTAARIRFIVDATASEGAMTAIRAARAEAEALNALTDDTPPGRQ